MKTVISGLILCLILVPLAAPAAELGDLFNQVESQLKEGQPAKALDTMRQATAVVWQKTPLSFRNTVLIVGDPQAFGQYEPRGSNVYTANEPVLIYVEPLGYKFVEEDGQYVFKLSADLALMAEDGNILGGQKGFNTWEFRSRELIFDFFLNLTYNFSGVPAGNYIVETTLHDLNSGQEASFQTKVVFE